MPRGCSAVTSEHTQQLQALLPAGSTRGPSAAATVMVFPAGAGTGTAEGKGGTLPLEDDTAEGCVVYRMLVW
jgi:hypothetical protein